MCSPSPPPPPDYAGAATAQGAANLDAARASSKLSNPSFSNPLGQREVTFGYQGDPDAVYVSDTLSPLGQSNFDAEQRIKSQLSGIAEGGLGRVGTTMETPFDTSSISPKPIASDIQGRDLSTQSLIERNQPMMDRQRGQLEQRLANQGIPIGSEAYQNAMDDLARQENDFRLGAVQAGGAEQSRMYGLGSQARQADIQEQAYLRQLPLTEVNALRTGAQPIMPQFQQFRGSDAAPAPIFGATQAQGQADINQYNARAGSRNAMTSGLFGLGAAGLTGAGAAGGFGNLFG